MNSSFFIVVANQSMTYRRTDLNKISIVEDKGGELPLETPTVPMDLTMALERGGLHVPKARKKIDGEFTVT